MLAREIDDVGSFDDLVRSSFEPGFGNMRYLEGSSDLFHYLYRSVGKLAVEPRIAIRFVEIPVFYEYCVSDLVGLLAV